MDEQNRHPHEHDGSTGDPGRPYQPRQTGPADETGPIGQSEQAGAYADHTRPLPPFQSGPPTASLPPVVGPFYGGSTNPPPPAARKRSGLTAAVLVGALVLGGAAGVGGSAAYQALNDDATNTSSTDSGSFEATKTAVVEDGTVEKVANAVLPSVVKVNVSTRSGSGSGSGIVLSEDGEILTNNHVISGAGDSGSISVSFNDGTTRKATVVGTDPLTDIAVIKVEGASDLVPAALGKSGELQVGQAVVAVGSPYGLNATVTSGIVSALNRPVSVSTEKEQEEAPQSPFGGEQNPFGGEQDQQQGALSTTYPAIQTDAAINPGNSGGPLVDLSGRVVGINSSIRTASSEVGGSIGLGFAIPIDEVLPIINQITAGEKPTHARLGVSVSDVTGNTLAQGAQLGSLEKGGSAEKAGLKEGDVITKVDDHVIDGSESLVATIRGHRPDDEVEITYLRDGRTETVTATLGSDADGNAS